MLLQKSLVDVNSSSNLSQVHWDTTDEFGPGYDGICERNCQDIFAHELLSEIRAGVHLEVSTDVATATGISSSGAGKIRNKQCVSGGCQTRRQDKQGTHDDESDGNRETINASGLQPMKKPHAIEMRSEWFEEQCPGDERDSGLLPQVVAKLFSVTLLESRNRKDILRHGRPVPVPSGVVHLIKHFLQHHPKHAASINRPVPETVALSNADSFSSLVSLRSSVSLEQNLADLLHRPVDYEHVMVGLEFQEQSIRNRFTPEAARNEILTMEQGNAICTFSSIFFVPSGSSRSSSTSVKCRQ